MTVINDTTELESMYNKGVSVAEIASKFGVDKSTVYKRIKKLNIEKPTSAPSFEVVEPEEKFDALATVNEDFPCSTNSIKLDFVTFDVETTNLTADFSVILCACIKPFNEKPIVFRADEMNPRWETARMDDSAIVKAVAKELAKHAVVITHYGSKFDIPYLRAKMAKLCLPALPPMFGIDTWRIAKNNFQVSSRRLANLGLYFELGQKSGVDGPLWLKAGMDGSRKAMDEIVAHNIQDVILLERLAAISFPYLKSIPRL
jgi:uncharacterized protein YprB with RNaseH-like and TPR domain